MNVRKAQRSVTVKRRAKSSCVENGKKLRGLSEKMLSAGHISTKPARSFSPPAPRPRIAARPPQAGPSRAVRP